MWDQAIEFLNQQLANNQFFQGAGLVAVAAAVWSWVRGWPGIIWGWIKYHTMVEIDVPNSNAAFSWIEKWLAQHDYTQKWARRISVSGGFATSNTKGFLRVTLAPGKHYIYRKWFGLTIIERTRNTSVSSGGDSARKAFYESYTIKMFGRNRARAFKLIEEARQVAEDGFINKVHIRKIRYDSSWEHMGTREGRSLDSVILQDGLRDGITNDMDWFLKNRQWYNERGVPYRRSYLFYGPPGNGKTSLVLALATKFNLDVCVVTLVDMTDDDLLSAFSHTRPGDLLLIEDVDALFRSREMNTNSPYEKHNAPVTFSGMLNGLDGITSSEGHIIVMTTNFKDRLDPALLRPGRVDMDVEFGDATPLQAAAIYRRFYPGVGDDLVDEFARRVPPSSMAAIQGHLIQYPTSPEEAISYASAIRTTNEPTTTQKNSQG